MYAAPHSSFNPTLGGLDFESQNKIEDWYKCILDVIDNAVGDSHVKAIYEPFRKTLYAIANNEKVKCRKIEDTKEKHQYV